jgi:hypothetical protein
MKYGNLNFLEPSGPLQACNGTALPFYCTYKLDCSLKFIAEHWIKTGDQKLQRVPEVIFCFLKKMKPTISQPK